jgi:hypothetical protein
MVDKQWHDYSAMTAALSRGADDLLLRDKSAPTDNATEGTVYRLSWEALLGVSGVTPGGRLTLESGVTFSTTDQTAKSMLYYCPHAHDLVRLYDGTRPVLHTFTERSLSLTMTSGKNYDVFLYDASGTLTLELSAAWTTDTARADALAWQSGVGWVKSGAATRLWLGTIRASGTNTTEASFDKTDTPAKSFVWNRYNRVRRTLKVIDSTNTWNYTTATWRQSRASANNQVEFVIGDVMEISCIGYGITTNANAAGRATGIGIDSTSSPTGLPGYFSGLVSYTGAANQVSVARPPVVAGYHYVALLEYAEAIGTASWYGDAGVPNNQVQQGLYVEIDT